ncbi:unnamed protein product [Haemonchus placei]|uniref:Uncharacterized protein n=1 Tax=Haemonchus placei TaxID=6290 RepID=A0A0N4WCR9_HAEPC|nr:unnamed protein product [Haemonchus placei]
MKVVFGERSTGESTKAMVAGSQAAAAWSGEVIEDEEADLLWELDDEEETASSSRGLLMYGNVEVFKEQAENLNRVQESSVENDVGCGNGSTEECISLLNIWRREKDKFKKSGPSVYTKDRCSAGVGSSKFPATLRTALTSNEEQANDAVKVLVEFLGKAKKEKTFKQQLCYAALATPNLNKFFDMVSSW